MQGAGTDTRPLGQLIDGQVIEPRKAQIAAYSRAAGVIPDKIDSYLYRQEEDRHVSETEEGCTAKHQEIHGYRPTPKSVIIKKRAVTFRKSCGCSACMSGG